MKAAKSSGKCRCVKSREAYVYVCVVKPLYDDDFENKMLSGADWNKF